MIIPYSNLRAPQHPHSLFVTYYLPFYFFYASVFLMLISTLQILQLVQNLALTFREIII